MAYRVGGLLTIGVGAQQKQELLVSIGPKENFFIRHLQRHLLSTIMSV